MSEKSENSDLPLLHRQCLSSIVVINPFLPGGAFGGVLESIVHKSAYSGPINMISSAKWIFYVLPIHVACSIMQIGLLVPKLQQVTGLRGR